ncbi:MAG: hypothetical protein M0Z28_11685 [Rhodospirillales bacterium]|nr:hypothetical protein [Rhodospirillales bacterium]
MTAPAAPPRRLPRRAALALAATALPTLLLGCAQPAPPQSFPPLTFGYLTKLKLDVANIGVDNAWTPSTVANGEHVESQSPAQPVDALRRMVQDRLIPGGTTGAAVVTIDDASLTRVTDRFEASFAVHMDIHNADGTRSGYAEAKVARTRTISNYAPPAVRQALYDLVKATMADMNVEFEYQVRHSLKDWLQTTAPAAPVPPPVEQQDLGSPQKS